MTSTKKIQRGKVSRTFERLRGNGWDRYALPILLMFVAKRIGIFPMFPVKQSFPILFDPYGQGLTGVRNPLVSPHSDQVAWTGRRSCSWESHRRWSAVRELGPPLRPVLVCSLCQFIFQAHSGDSISRKGIHSIIFEFLHPPSESVLMDTQFLGNLWIRLLAFKYDLDGFYFKLAIIDSSVLHGTPIKLT